MADQRAELTDLTIANFIEAMGMFIHDMDQIVNGNGCIYNESNYNVLADAIRMRRQRNDNI